MSDPVDYSLVSPSVMDDPMAAFAELRAKCPVHHGQDLGVPLYHDFAVPGGPQGAHRPGALVES